MSVNTPTKTFGEGAGRAADLQYWEKTARQILACSTSNKIVVEKSTLPVRTAEAMERILNSNTRGLRFEVLSNPEFLAEGTAIADLEQPDRVLIGSHETPDGHRGAEGGRRHLRHLGAARADHRVEPVERRAVEAGRQRVPGAAHLLDQRASRRSARRPRPTWTRSRYAIGTDSRIGSAFPEGERGVRRLLLQEGHPESGLHLRRAHGLDEVARYWEAVVRMNDWQETRFVRRMLASMFNTVAGKRIALFGFAFKADTGDTRESPALRGDAPAASTSTRTSSSPTRRRSTTRASTPRTSRARSCSSPTPTAPHAARTPLRCSPSGISIESSTTRGMLASMERPAFVFDGRNILDRQRLFDLGFNVFAIGKPALRHV